MNFFFLIFFFYNFLLFLCNSYICYLSLNLSSLLSISILFLFFTFCFILLFGIIFNLKLNPFRVIILFSWSAFQFRKKEMEIGWVSVRERGKEKQIEITRKRGREIISEVVGREQQEDGEKKYKREKNGDMNFLIFPRLTLLIEDTFHWRIRLLRRWKWEDPKKVRSLVTSISTFFRGEKKDFRF